MNLSLSISAERPAPLQQLTGLMRAALLALAANGGRAVFLPFLGGWQIKGGAAGERIVKQATMKALAARGLVTITGSSRQVATLTRHGEHVVRTLEREQRARVRFDCSPAEALIVQAIVERGWKLGWLRKSYLDKLDMRMDVLATHANGNPLRLADLLAADDFNFAHDMSGICNCLDRRTGKLTRNFSPRFSQRSAA